MTNKEVIEQLKGIRSDYERDCKHSLFKEMLYQKDIEAINIAIKALEEKQQGELKGDAKNKLDYKVINRGKCMLCGKELTEGVFFCKECEQKGDKK